MPTWTMPARELPATALRLLEPDPARHARYDELYARFQDLYLHLKDDFHWLAGFGRTDS